MGRVSGKKVVITGGAQGLGACFARMLTDEGAKVFLTDINGDGAEATAAAINEKHAGAASSIEHDVTNRDDWTAALEAASEAMGGIDTLINNAGVGTFGSIETETEENWRRTQAIDVDSIFTGTQLAMPYLKRSQPGSIINISSVAGLIADGNMIAYNTAKAAVWMMTKSIALHCARSGYDIRCNSVHPVFTRTPIIDPLIELGGGGDEGEKRLVQQIPWRRLAEPEDVGYCILYLAADESRYITASEFKIDGGITAQ
ncbi:SDR family oxidoreductase [Hyphococcus luteus]|uniref:3-beta hydroxysteroid dehydrogenase n=1 Tax=Hyphococcus luteus TaxID=2058213 RepID=A0A2S7K4P4_9PROT|nr:SDR family oxidoreductase [Marinicaulis flavus]PQA87451.1 3-beta hydroxysteroid dehydrogenase [Marinicaulis flavus]